MTTLGYIGQDDTTDDVGWRSPTSPAAVRAVRDSKSRADAVLSFTAAQWSVFVAVLALAGFVGANHRI